MSAKRGGGGGLCHLGLDIVEEGGPREEPMGKHRPETDQEADIGVDNRVKSALLRSVICLIHGQALITLGLVNSLPYAES